jgi:hypothetical protein
MLLPITEDPSTSSTHTECGADTKRTLTIAPGSVVLSLAEGTSVELQERTWEYGFTSDAPLELHFESLGSFTCMVNGEMVEVGGDGPHWSCKRPPDDKEMSYEFSFRYVSATNQGMLGGQIDKPVGAQPTLIIRTKRNCPTGLSTKPTIDG